MVLNTFVWLSGAIPAVLSTTAAKVLDGTDRRVLREVGISLDRSGRRVTGIDLGEYDQGQHDHNRAVMAVSSAGSGWVQRQSLHVALQYGSST